MRSLQARVPQLGDVRGLGSMIGLEFVRDPHTREPAPELAAASPSTRWPRARPAQGRTLRQRDPQSRATRDHGRAARGGTRRARGRDRARRRDRQQPEISCAGLPATSPFVQNSCRIAQIPVEQNCATPERRPRLARCAGGTSQRALSWRSPHSAREARQAAKPAAPLARPTLAALGDQLRARGSGRRTPAHQRAADERRHLAEPGAGAGGLPRPHLARRLDARRPAGARALARAWPRARSWPSRATPGDAVAMWLRSPGHRENLLRPSFTHAWGSAWRAASGTGAPRSTSPPTSAT